MSSVWSGVIGQDQAVERLRRSARSPVQAYLFVGPAGSTKDVAARAFAALLLNGNVDDGDERRARLALAGHHPDVREVERSGAAISRDQAREIVKVASLAPVEGAVKVVVLHEFHLLDPEGAAVLLKTIEEPPPSTTFIILADHVPADLVTIASRCVRVDFQAIDVELIAATLQADGAEETMARIAAESSGGDIHRARLLAADPDLLERRRAFGDAPRQLDGTGHRVMTVVDDLTARIAAAAEPLVARQATEVTELNERIERFGERGSGRQALEARHRRELRRHRTDELRAGLAHMAASYRDALVEHPHGHAAQYAAAVTRIHETIELLDRNPNEALQLQALLWTLPPIA